MVGKKKVPKKSRIKVRNLGGAKVTDLNEKQLKGVSGGQKMIYDCPMDCDRLVVLEAVPAKLIVSISCPGDPGGGPLTIPVPRPRRR
jgi:hypothetical protein